MAASEIGGGDRVFSVTDDVTRWRRAKLKGETGFPKCWMTSEEGYGSRMRQKFVSPRMVWEEWRGVKEAWDK
jgi:hypothetical protein